MTDKELLELAAKAMGYKYMSNALWDGRDVVEYEWNPLKNDDHALRLAVKCRISLYLQENFPEMEVGFFDEKNQKWEFVLGIEIKNREQTVRSCIVRAAAEIGKTLE